MQKKKKKTFYIEIFFHFPSKEKKMNWGCFIYVCV